MISKKKFYKKFKKQKLKTHNNLSNTNNNNAISPSTKRKLENNYVHGLLTKKEHDDLFEHVYNTGGKWIKDVQFKNQGSVFHYFPTGI